MKKLILLLIPLLFLSCTKTVYIDSQSGEDITGKVMNNKLLTSDFLRYEILCEFSSLSYKDAPWRVYKDTYTDVLYAAWNYGNAYTVTPIMKPDGSCLTYKEWQLRKMEK